MTETWAIVELMGHVKLAGKLAEEEHFGSKLGRVDVPRNHVHNCPNCAGGKSGYPCPLCAGGNMMTVFFGGASVYRITPVSEEVARQAAKSLSHDPISHWDYPEDLKQAARQAKALTAVVEDVTVPRCDPDAIDEADFSSDDESSEFV